MKAWLVFRSHMRLLFGVCPECRSKGRPCFVCCARPTRDTPEFPWPPPAGILARWHEVYCERLGTSLRFSWLATPSGAVLLVAAVLARFAAIVWGVGWLACRAWESVG